MKNNDVEAVSKKSSDKKAEAEKLKKQKKREAAKAKRLKLIEKRKAKIEANKKKRAEKKAKKLAKLEKQKAKKLAAKAKKLELRKKKLERLAKQKAKAKELKLKAKQKAKTLKNNTENLASKHESDTIDITIKLLKNYVKQLAKDKVELDEKKIKKLEALGFTFNDDAVSFTFVAKRKTKKQVVVPEVVEEPEVVEPEKPAEEIDDAIDAVIGDKSNEIEALAEELKTNDEDGEGTEVPVGDTFSDSINVETVENNEGDEFDDDNDEDEDSTIDDYRDENDADKVDFRRDWNNEFNDDGERNEDW